MHWGLTVSVAGKDDDNFVECGEKGVDADEESLKELPSNEPYIVECDTTGRPLSGKVKIQLKLKQTLQIAEVKVTGEPLKA